MNIPVTLYDYVVFNGEVFMIQQLNGSQTTGNISIGNIEHFTL